MLIQATNLLFWGCFILLNKHVGISCNSNLAPADWYFFFFLIALTLSNFPGAQLCAGFESSSWVLDAGLFIPSIKMKTDCSVEFVANL